MGDMPGALELRMLADKACPAIAHPYFYRLEKAGKVSYILGTRHLGVSLDKMPALVKDQIRAAKLAVFETPPEDDGASPPVATTSIADQLGPTLWARYRSLVGGENATAVEHAAPPAAVITMIALYEDKLAALDIELEKVAADEHIPTRGLETSAFQDHLLVELMDLRMLKAAIAGTPDRETLKREAIDDLSEYCAGTGESPGMDEHAKEKMRAAGYSNQEIAEIDDKLVFARNRDWIPKLETILAPGDVFVAVGADHLIGPRGVVALLAAKGWKATRVP
jgi:hypothetical protein